MPSCNQSKQGMDWLTCSCSSSLPFCQSEADLLCHGFPFGIPFGLLEVDVYSLGGVSSGIKPLLEV